MSEASEHIQYSGVYNSLDPGFHRGDEYSVLSKVGSVLRVEVRFFVLEFPQEKEREKREML